MLLHQLGIERAPTQSIKSPGLSVFPLKEWIKCQDNPMVLWELKCYFFALTLALFLLVFSWVTPGAKLALKVGDWGEGGKLYKHQVQ